MKRAILLRTKKGAKKITTSETKAILVHLQRLEKIKAHEKLLKYRQAIIPKQLHWFLYLITMISNLLEGPLISIMCVNDHFHQLRYDFILMHAVLVWYFSLTLFDAEDFTWKPLQISNDQL